MSSRVRTHIRSNAVGYVALFVALSGTATALPGKNTVDSGDIAPRQVKSGDLADNAVTNAKLAANAVDAGKVADNSLGGSEIDESNLDSTILQNRVTESCADGQVISAIHAAGNVTCRPFRPSVLAGGIDQAVGNGDYMSPVSGTTSATYGRNAVAIPIPSVLSNFRVTLPGAAASPIAVALWANGNATTMSCTIPAGQSTCASPDSWVVLAGDTISYRLTSSSAITNGISFGLAVAPTGS